MTDPGAPTPRDPAMPGPEPMMPPQPMTPPPPLPSPASGAGAPGDLANRFFARFIDGIVLAVVNAIISAIMFGGFIGFMGPGFGFGFSGRLLLYSIISAAIAVAYFSLMESNSGQTLGKMALSLRTNGPGGGNPTMEQALKRNSFYALAIIPVIGWLIQLGIVIYIAVTINSSPTRQGWHDTFAGGTQVVKTK